MDDKTYSSRKFILACVAIIAEVVLVSLDILDNSTYNTMILGVLGLYYTGNVLEASGILVRKA